MRNKLVIGLLLACFVFCLSSCGRTERELQQENHIGIEKGAKEWYQDKLYVGTTSGWLFYVDEVGDDLQFGLDTKQIALINKNDYEISNSDEYGKVIRYKYNDKNNDDYECRIDYFVDKDEIIVGLFQGDSEFAEVCIYYGSRSDKSNDDELTKFENNIDYEWYNRRFYRDISRPAYWINFSDTKNGLTVNVPGYSFEVEQPEVIVSEEYGTVLRYHYKEYYGRFEFYIDYMTRRDEIIVLYTDYTIQSPNAADYSGVYSYDSQLTASMYKDSMPDQDQIDYDAFDDISAKLRDGQRFECFETVGGEDVIIIVNKDSSKTTLTIGDLAPITLIYRESIEGYEGYLEDDPDTHIFVQFPNGELELTVCGQYYIYGGTYIQLPDIDDE